MVVALVDDNKAEIDKTKRYLLQEFEHLSFPVKKLDIYPSGEVFLREWENHSYDLIVLDIIMGNINGIEVAQQIRKKNHKVRIVFCSSSNEYAFESYRVGASYYLQKPITQERMAQMLSRLDIADYELRVAVTLPSGEKLTLREMIYSEYSNHVISIHLKNGSVIKVRMSQTDFQALLAEYSYFYSCNKGNVLNFYEVKEYQKDVFVMSNDEVLPISRRKQNETEEAYHEFLFQSMQNEMI